MITQNIRVVDIVPDGVCISPDDGDILFDRVCTEIDSGVRVNIFFDSVDILTTAFLNHSVGRLYVRYAPGVLDAFLMISCPDPFHDALIRRVISNAVNHKPQDSQDVQT